MPGCKSGEYKTFRLGERLGNLSAKGFDLVAPDDDLFIPELRSVEGILFPNDTRSARNAVGPSERLATLARGS